MSKKSEEGSDFLDATDCGIALGWEEEEDRMSYRPFADFGNRNCGIDRACKLFPRQDCVYRVVHLLIQFGFAVIIRGYD